MDVDQTASLFGISAEFLGAGFGLAIGLINFVILMRVAEATERAAKRPGGSDGARILRWVAWADLAVFPLIGFFIAPMLLP